MDKPIVSVIVPVHNAEKYLEKCLDSVTEQTLSEIEIICVDDGSEDGSLEILKNYQEKDNRIQIISQPNSNGGVARNTGMKKATGEYMVFWDSDDFFALDALELMVEQIKADQADICVCNADRFNDVTQEFDADIKYIIPSKIPSKIPYSRHTIPDTILNVTNNVPWNKLYRREFIQKNGLEFQDIARSNDTFFVMMAIVLAENITMVNKKLIHYRYNNAQSLTGTLSTSPLLPLEAYRKTKAEMIQRGVFEDVQKSFANRFIGGILFILENQKNESAFNEVFEYISDGGFYEMGLKENSVEEFHYPEKYTEYQFILKHDYVGYFLFKREAQKINDEKILNRVKIRCDKKIEIEKEKCNAEKEKYNKLKETPTWKVGKAVMFLPRKITGLFGK